jgi:hypothetical protein
MDKVVDDEEKAINNRNDKQDLDFPGEGQFKLGFGELFFDLGIFFQGKLLGFGET